jgi:branched-chain amino acid transport system permease protein
MDLWNDWRKALGWGILGAFLVMAPFGFGTYLLFVFSVICVYILVALGMNILAGYTGMLSLGSQAFFGIGAYCAAVLGTRFPGFPFVIALFVGGLFSGVIGFANLRSLSRHRDDCLRNDHE